MLGQAIEAGCRAIPGLSRWYQGHYVTIKRLEKRLRPGWDCRARPLL